MQQERGGGGGGGQQQQDRRLKLLHPPENQQPQQPQKCPRCESLNTKFCYYNNYSLTQPRYFCKGCRRYWTQGGTLRNVPVGGGCRKGKRPKKPSPSTEKPSQEHNQNQHLLQLQQPNSNATSTSLYTKRENDNSITSPSIFYPSGGFLSSSGVNQPFNQQPINFMSGGDFMGSNLALLQGFSLPSLNPLHQLQHQQIQQSQLLQQSSSNASYWSNNNGGSSLNSSQLPDLSGYGIPPHPHPHPHQPPSSSFL